MTVLLYDYRDLEERAGRHLKAWKVWHLILYSLAAVFGVVNYVLLHQTTELVGEYTCILYPRVLEFHVITRRNATPEETYIYDPIDNTTEAENATTAQDTVPDVTTVRSVSKREIPDNYTTVEDRNTAVIAGNVSRQTVLDARRSLFARNGACQFAEYMPIMSSICALLWVTLFTMCPGGGRPHSGLKHPWRILTPALLFALVLVGLTGHSFARTNGGLQAFCAAFVNVSGSTKCSSVDPFLEKSQSPHWTFGAGASVTRAASAAVWASWACAAALLFARCLAAPDFVVKRTGVYLKDPHGKLTPHLRKSRRRRRSPASPGSRRDNASVASDPTCTTDLATASASRRDPDSAPTSLQATPLRKDHEGHADLIEMTYTPQERPL